MEAISSAVYLIRDWWNDKPNRSVVLIALIGLPFLVEAFRGKFWAQPALQVYLCSSIVVWFLWSVRKMDLRSHAFVALALIASIHTLLMVGLVVMNCAAPDINNLPQVLYGFLAGLIALELWGFSKMLNVFQRQRTRQRRGS